VCALEQDRMVALIKLHACIYIRLDDFYETIVKEVIADDITPLVTNPGRLMLTSSRLYFQPFNNATTVNYRKLCYKHK